MTEILNPTGSHFVLSWVDENGKQFVLLSLSHKALVMLVSLTSAVLVKLTI